MGTPLETAVFAYARARSASYAVEYYLLNSLSIFLPKSWGAAKVSPPDFKTLTEIRRDLLELLRRDSHNMSSGLYPVSVLWPESPARHLGRLPKLLADSYAIHRRRLSGKTREFDRGAREFLPELPRYYRRNFHFQSSGYLSQRSAEVYEHQVELLFKGTADAMRRLVLSELRRKFGPSSGEGLKFLEIGAGTGRATRFVHLAFPKAKIVAIDLSDPYLKIAQKNLSDCPRIDFFQADGANLPFRDSEFDAVYSVFLFHELPRTARQAVLAEAARVLKPGGFVGAVDSLQLGDKALFDPLLKHFPKEFHEPFYRDYVGHRMEKLFAAQGFRDLRSELGFSSKLCVGNKPLLPRQRKSRVLPN